MLNPINLGALAAALTSLIGFLITRRQRQSDVANTDATAARTITEAAREAVEMLAGQLDALRAASAKHEIEITSLKLRVVELENEATRLTRVLRIARTYIAQLRAVMGSYDIDVPEPPPELMEP